MAPRPTLVRWDGDILVRPSRLILALGKSKVFALQRVSRPAVLPQRDEAMGNITATYKAKEMWDNTLVVVSDSR